MALVPGNREDSTYHGDFPNSCLSSPLLRPTMEKSFIHLEKRSKETKEKN